MKIRYGMIQEEAGGWARVFFQTAGGDTVSPLLPVVQRSTVGDRDYRPLGKGSLVAVMLGDDGEGVILGAVYNDKDTPPAGADDKTWITEFGDGTSISYDTGSKKLTLAAAGDIEITVEGTCSVTAETCDIGASSGTINGLRCQFTGAPRHSFG